MVMTSAQIAQMNGAFQGQSMNQMAYSGMIAQQSPYSGERMAGSTMNTLGALASPVAMGGMALAGLDPISMGIRGGMAGAGMGTAGMAAGAIGGAAMVAAPLMAAQYMGGQFMQGAQQHQQLGGQLRSSFGFQNQFGGNGFTGGQVGQIGSAMRGMVGEQGPGGEMVSFDELGRLASNMGRMGMGQGVRNAKDFTDKFKTMVKSLKEIASEMGTSLEEAQKMMAGMKQSGVFGNANQVAMSRQIRIGAQAGGLATSELTGMASVGSQISRMVGGRGAAGAAGGVETITNIGVAQQMGILSEEDIYNQTGEVGAMGRRSMAVGGMERAARFYKSGMGRRMLAAMAGKNGQLDESDAEEIAEGGVSVNRTRQMWKENLAGVGQANFIRNEGKLRGEALKRFGALGPAMWMKSLMEQKGIDVNEDNDRAMLFLQRRMKMGVDEASNELKMIQNLPAILKERKVVGQEESMAQRMKARQQTTGIEGLKRKLDRAVTEVNGDIQQAGAGFMQNLENEFEGMVNWLTETRVKEFRRDVVRALDRGRGGGSSGNAAMAQTFGVGGGVASNLRQVAGKVGGGDVAFNLSELQENSRVGRGIVSKAMGMGGGFVNEFNRVDRERLSKSGYSVGENLDKAGIQARLKEIQSFAGAATGRGIDVSLTKDARSSMREAFANQVTGTGEARARSVQKMLLSSGDPEMKKLGEQMGNATPSEKGNIIAGVNRALGISDESKLYATGDSLGVYNTSEYLTVRDQSEAIGGSLLGSRDEGLITSAARAGLSGFKKGGSVWGASAMVGDIGKRLFGLDEATNLRADVGRFARTEEARGLAARAIGTDAGAREAARGEVTSKMIALKQKQAEAERSGGEFSSKGELEYLRSVQAAQKMQSIGGAGASKKAVAAAAKSMGMTPDEFSNRVGGVVGVVMNDQREAVMALDGVQSKARMTSMTDSGLVVIGKDGKAELRGEVADALGDIPGGKFLKAMIEEESKLAGLEEGNLAGNQAILEDVGGRGGAIERRNEALGQMSVSGMRSAADTLRGKGAPEIRQMLLHKAGLRDRLAKGGKSHILRNLSGALGAGLDKDELLAALKGGGEAGVVEALVGGTGIESEAGKTAIKEATAAMQKGDIATAEEKISGLGGELQEARKKKTLAAQKDSNPLQVEANQFLKGIEEVLKEQKTTMTRIASNTEPIFGSSE